MAQYSLCGPEAAGYRSGSESESGCEQGHGCGLQVVGGCHGGQEAAAAGTLEHGQLGVPGALCEWGWWQSISASQTLKIYTIYQCVHFRFSIEQLLLIR